MRSCVLRQKSEFERENGGEVQTEEERETIIDKLLEKDREELGGGGRQLFVLYCMAGVTGRDQE